MKHIPVDTKRYEDAKAASLRRNITDKVSSSQSDDGPYYTAETSQHGEDELGHRIVMSWGLPVSPHEKKPMVRTVTIGLL